MLVISQKDIISLTRVKFKANVLSTLDKGLLIGRCSIVHRGILFFVDNNGVADSEVRQNFPKRVLFFVVVVIKLGIQLTDVASFNGVRVAIKVEWA